MEPTTVATSHFHNIRPEFSVHTIDAALASGLITRPDADLIREFIAERRSCIGISAGRVNKISFTLVGWRRFIGPFAENTIGDVFTAIPVLKESKNQRGRLFKSNTIADYVAILKQFYLWMIENNYSTIEERKLRKLRLPKRDAMTKTASDLLTPDEVTAILHACMWSRDRALISLLYEGGFRIGELGVMQWGEIQFDRYGAIVNVNFKTGIPRYVRIIMSKESLAQWRRDYPGTPEGKALVFLNERGRPLTHGAVSRQLDRLAKRAGIKKRITPHLFRHSRITHLIREGVSESVIKLMMWGSLSSKMFQTYAHLTGTDIDAELLQTYGIAKETNKKEARRVEPRICPHCNTINAPVSNYCSVCGQKLTGEIVGTDADIQTMVLNNPDALKEYIDRKVQETIAQRLL